jgi:hypothetical protein
VVNYVCTYRMYRLLIFQHRYMSSVRAGSLFIIPFLYPLYALRARGGLGVGARGFVCVGTWMNLSVRGQVFKMDSEEFRQRVEYLQKSLNEMNAYNQQLYKHANETEQCLKTERDITMKLKEDLTAERHEKETIKDDLISEIEQNDHLKEDIEATAVELEQTKSKLGDALSGILYYLIF